MPRLSEREILKREAKRDLSAELRADMKALRTKGIVARVTVLSPEGKTVESRVAKVRLATRLSQSKFAELLGVSVRTLQGWEQCRREPRGAAASLLRIAEKRPDVLRELL